MSGGDLSIRRRWTIVAATASFALAAPAAGAFEVSTNTEVIDAATRSITSTDDTIERPAAFPAADYSPLDVSDPVLGPDSSFEPTDWGFKHVDLELPEDGDWPTVLRKDGYAGATAWHGVDDATPNAYLRMPDNALIALAIDFGHGPRGDYARVYASIRGTECSAGNFSLYDRRHAWDGHEIVEWIAEQEWSNGRVGMEGGSYYGQTTYLTASTQPPSLKAVMPSLLHADIYRDIFMPGGVQNYVFPVIWYLQGPNRAPVESFQDGTMLEDEICTQNQATRSALQDGELPHEATRSFVLSALEPTDNAWYAAHAAQNYAHLIDIPYYQQHNWHDEQTGPRAAVLWHHVHPEPQEIVTAADADRRPCQRPRSEVPPSCLTEVDPKLLVTSTGDHGFGGFAGREQYDWFDIWLLDQPDRTGLLDEPVRAHFETRGDGTYTARKVADEWPFPDTDWQRWHLHEDGLLARDAHEGESDPDRYVSGVATRNWPQFGGQTIEPLIQLAAQDEAGDAVIYESEPLEEDLAIAGPMLLDLYASLEGTNTNLFASVHAVWPNGDVSYLQRGMLRASHRDIDERRSYYTEQDGEQVMVQPYRPHTNPRPVTPGEVEEYRIEIWPQAHRFTEGNRLRIQVHTPPALDGIWGYTHRHEPAGVTIHRDERYPSALQLPVVDGLTEGEADPLEDCHMPNGFPCAEGAASGGTDLAVPTDAQVSSAVSRFADLLEESAPQLAEVIRPHTRR